MSGVAVTTSQTPGFSHSSEKINLHLRNCHIAYLGSPTGTTCSTATLREWLREGSGGSSSGCSTGRNRARSSRPSSWLVTPALRGMSIRKQESGDGIRTESVILLMCGSGSRVQWPITWWGRRRWRSRGCHWRSLMSISSPARWTMSSLEFGSRSWRDEENERKEMFRSLHVKHE